MTPKEPKRTGARPPKPINLPRRGAPVTRRTIVQGDFAEQMREHPVRWNGTKQSGTDEPEATA